MPLNRCWRLVFCYCLGVASAQAGEAVVLYGDAAYPPYSYLEGKEFKGIYVDLLRQAADRLKPRYTIALVPVPWKRGLRYLEKGEAFALFPPGLKKEREYIQTYSVALYQETEVVFCNDQVIKSSPKRFPEDFVGLTMGVNAGFLLSDRLMQASRSGIVKIEEAPSNASNLRKLALLRLDCYVSDRGAALYSAQQLRNEDKTFTLRLHETAVLSGEDTFIGYSANANPPYKADFIQKMDEALTALKRDGTAAKIVRAYLR
jgi:polar amino acid transport system substrate-binding protein